MKFLLTSAGLKNKTLIDEFLKLVNKPANEIKLAYIPTAANVEPDDKGWMIDILWEFKNLVSEVDIVEIATLPRAAFMPRLEWADAIAIGGGNPYFLLNWLRKSGLDDEIRNLLESRVYVGISSGSMIVGPDISITNDLLPEVVKLELKDYIGLQLVDFEIVPHYNSESFSKVREPELKKYQQKSKIPFYVIDDQSAIKVVDKNIEPVGEGEWLEFGK